MPEVLCQYPVEVDADVCGACGHLWWPHDDSTFPYCSECDGQAMKHAYQPRVVRRCGHARENHSVVSVGLCIDCPVEVCEHAFVAGVEEATGAG